MELIISISFLIIITLKNIIAIKGIILSRKFLRSKSKKLGSLNTSRILIVIPVLREVNVIENTLNHFSKLKLKNIQLSIVLVGTVREIIEDKRNSELLTRDVILRWVEKHKENNANNTEITYEYMESNDPQGDRASQITFAVEQFKIKETKGIDIIGIYDADSLPQNTTLEEVRAYFDAGVICCQQPVHFNRAASQISQAGGNPVIVANGLYQTTWTIIRELPRWIANSTINQNYPRNLYIIGHGEFLAPRLYEEFGFPSDDVTDGIQLGYRLGMCNVKIYPLRTFCNDDIPRSITQTIHQHKRWFGGCMRLKSAYSWVKMNCTISRTSITQLIDGYWSQISWAFAAPFAIMAIITTFAINDEIASIIIQITIFLNLTTYCYFVPYLAHRSIDEPINVRIRDWLALPLAIFIKCIGPNIFIFESIISQIDRNKNVTYKKVDR